MRDPGLPLPAPARARQPWSLRRQLLTGILVPVILFIGFNTWSLYHQTLAALNTAYDRTLLASAKSISEQLDVTGYDESAQLHAIVPYSALEIFEADRKSTRLNSSHLVISYAVFCLKKKKNNFSHIFPIVTPRVHY